MSEVRNGDMAARHESTNARSPSDFASEHDQIDIEELIEWQAAQEEIRRRRKILEEDEENF